eukprot:COSAG01_NODE_32950_length_572_cov_4.852008_1_plen_89_part_00
MGGGGYGPIYSNTASLETVHRGLLNPKFRVQFGGKLTNLPIKMCYSYRGALLGSLRINMCTMMAVINNGRGDKEIVVVDSIESSVCTH